MYKKQKRTEIEFELYYKKRKMKTNKKRTEIEIELYYKKRDADRD
jgi:hypothetical protein